MNKLFDFPLVSNVFWLGVVRSVRVLLPLVLIPLISNNFGEGVLGRYLFFLAVSTWISIIVDFGFVFSATREVARHRSVNVSRLCEIVSGVTSAKLMVSLLLVFVFFILYLESVVDEDFIYGVVSGCVVGFVPTWFFNGIEKNRLLGIIDLTFSLLLVFYALFSQYFKWDYSCFIFFYISNKILSVLILYMLVFREIEVDPLVFLRRLNFVSGYDSLKKSKAMALFRMSTSLYISVNSIIVGLVLNPVALVSFSIPEKITRSVIGFLSPFSQVFFSRLSFYKNNEDADTFFFLSALITVAIGFFMSVAMYMFGHWAIVFFVSENYDSATRVLEIMSILPFVISISNVYGIQYLLPNGFDYVFNKVVISAGFINLSMIFFMIDCFGVEGAAYSIIITEVFVSSCMFFLYLKYRKC